MQGLFKDTAGKKWGLTQKGWGFLVFHSPTAQWVDAGNPLGQWYQCQ
ncbi:MAG: hypothetical protein H0A76_05725 [Candidatus Thiodubiliella endoseptemdiera]|uniref:Uncharacterized protein n=1 Tax=Candidatus Thiodubiliella endoseptemdiera TaxID=2738886 RepID=A0A853F1X8_9GAMM|nr:hypothetical protein [Candidatus Thiodubiliella endoseptemdiera]